MNKTRYALLAAMLGVLKAGGYFVCVEPGSPQAHWLPLTNGSVAQVLCAEWEDGLETVRYCRNSELYKWNLDIYHIKQKI